MRSHWARRRIAAVGRSMVAGVTTLALIGGVVAVHPAAARADAPANGVSDLLDVLGANGGANTLSSWTTGLGNVGKLAEALPLVPASPGGLLGFTDLFGKAVTDQLKAATTFDQLAVDKNVTIDGDRGVHLVTSVSDLDGGKKLDVTVDVSKSVTGQDLRVSSASPKVELSVAGGVTVEVKARLALSLVWTGASDKVYLVRTDATPRLDVDAQASIDGTKAAAAIGILGVTLTGSTLNLKAHLVGRVSDPNNDGRLAFTENAPGDGELAKQGSLEGLVSVGLDPEGSLPVDNSDPNSRGSIGNTTFTLGAALGGILPDPTNISASVTVSWPDIGVGAPTVSAPNLDATVGRFQNLSLQDLADGLAQVVTGITAVQQAKFHRDGTGPLVGNLDLPFMRGTLADAIKVNQALKDFLAQHVIQPGTPDPAKIGRPTFTSLQDLLKLLHDTAGITLDPATINWDPTTSKFSFTIGTTKVAPANPVDLDPGSAGASGPSAEYGPNTLKVANAGWSMNQWLGRRVTAGTAAGEVASNTVDTITLKENWIGGQPANPTPFVISGEQPHIGAVQLADRVDDGNGHGLVNANADQTFAKVTPSYTASVTLVLDLQNPRTGNDCVGFLGNTKPCPFTKEDGPLKTVVDALPLPTDRVMIRTGGSLFAADFPVTSNVDFTANAGFFKVRVTGALRMCSSTLADNCPNDTPTGHMLSVGLKQTGDAQHDLRLSELFQTLHDNPSSLLDIDVQARAFGDLSISLPDAQNFLPAGATAKFTAKMTNLTDPSTISFDTSDLSEIFKLDFDADNPKALFTALIKTLQTLSTQLAATNPNAGNGVFNAKIPGLGKSLRDLLLSDESNTGAGVSYDVNTLTDNRGFPPNLAGRTVVVGTQIGIVKQVSGDGKTLTLTKNWDAKPAPGTAYAMRSALDDATDQLLALVPDNIQDAVTLLNRTLGTDSVKFRYLEVNGVGNLVLDVDWKRHYHTASPIRLSLGNIAGSDRTFAGAQASGLAQVEVNGELKLGLALPLAAGPGPADGSALKILEDSSITVGAKAELKDGVVKGVVGPLSIALGNPTTGAPADQKAQAKADLSVGLAKANPAANTPVPFTDFVGALGVNFNATNAPVDCGEGLATKLMVCAKLPMFLNNSGAANGWTSLGQIAVRLPDSTDPADLVNLTGNLPPPDASKAKLELPDLTTALQQAILDFGNLGDGIEGYLTMVEQAFRTASFGGKLPLVGDDLQQGANFLGDLRTKLRESIWNQLPGGGRPANATEFKNFINAHLADELSGVDIAATDVAVDFNCTETLHKAGTPTVTPTIETKDPPLPTAQWQYKVVAYQANGDTVPSDPGTATGAATLDANSFNTVGWTAVDHATGYKILRKGANDTEFKLLKDAGNVLSYVDKNTDTPAAYQKVDAEPKLDPCPGEFTDGVSLEFTAQRGKVTTGEGCTNVGAPKDCKTGGVPLDIGIPGLALRQGKDNPNGINYKLGFALHFKLGLNKQDGFFINTHDGWQDDHLAHPELQVGFGFDLPKTMTAELAFITIDMSKATGAGHDPNRPLFAGAFQIDLKSAPDEESCFTVPGSGCTPTDSKIRFADLGNQSITDAFRISLTGAVHLDWLLKAQVTSAFPGVQANFQLDWAFNNQAPQAFGAPTIKFLHVGISAGDFFQHLLGDAVKEMKRVTGPIQPVIDTLYAPIPVLSDLSRMAGGDDVTLMTLAKAFNTLADGPSLDFVDTIKAILDFINRLPTCTNGDNCVVELGDFTLSGDKALNTSNSPTTAATMYESTNPASGRAVKDALNAVNATDGGQNKIFGPDAPPPPPGSAGTQAVDPKNKGDAEKSGFTFPILDHPEQAFNLLMGGDVTLVEFDSGPLTLGFSWRQAFGPVYAPPPVFVTLAGSASVTLHIRAGLDTYGLRKAVEAARNGTKVDALSVLDGLFFKTVDDTGKPAPVVQLDGEIAAGAAVSALVITVGIEGGLHLTIGFFWNDPNDDGKFRVSEFLHAALSNPLCLFTVSGRLSLFLRVYITLGFSIFSVTFSFTLADVTLLDFTVQPDCNPPPPKLGGTVGDTLVVYAGKFGGDSFRGAPWGNDKTDSDVVKVISLHYAQTKDDPQGVDGKFDGFAIEMLGERREYLDPSLKRVVIDGGGAGAGHYTKPMLVTFIGDGKKTTDDSAGKTPAVFDKDAVVIGGSGDDVINTGRGLSYVDGGPGADKIVTGDVAGSTFPSKAWVAGGAGDDTISVGNGGDQVAGDASLGTTTATKTVTHNDQDGKDSKDKVLTRQLTGLVDWTSVQDPTGQPGGDDQGADTIGVGLGQNKAVGNGGRDKIGVAADAPGTPAKPNVLVGGDGGDTITGGSNADVIFTGPEFGYDPNNLPVDEALSADSDPDPNIPNVVDTGTGSDTVLGSTWFDLVTSHSQGDQTAKLLGGGNDDVLIGGFGTDEVYGGPGDDYVVAEPADVSARQGTDGSFGPFRAVSKRPLPPGVDPHAKTLVGGLGNDHIIGGDGPATMFGDKRLDAEKCRPGNPVTSDPVAESTSQATGDGNDRILGGAGPDTVSGGGANDTMDLFGGNDLGCGQQGDDVLRGGSGPDLLWGGSGVDTADGDAGNDYLFGNAGNDFLYGGTESDVIEGNDGADFATGGADPDLIYGGTRAAGRTDSGGDVLNGDSGKDRLIGDNGTVDDPLTEADPPAIPFDLDGLTPAAGAADVLNGGADDDTGYGGLGDDQVNGDDGNDHLEGNNGADTVHGNAGEDEIAGGSFQQASAGVGRPDGGDFLFGDAGPDLMIGDNGVLAGTTDPAATTPVTRQRGFGSGHSVTLLDLGLTPAAGTSGNDVMSGGDEADVLYGQSGTDRAKGDAGDDYVEGGQGIDWIEGDGGADDLVGGSSTTLSGSGATAVGQLDAADAVFGGPGDDVALGDNGVLLRPAPGQTPTRATVRLATSGGNPVPGRIVQRYDTAAAPPADRFGDDRISGGSGVDVLYGQDGSDYLSGGGQADYAEGNGGNDVLRGDLSLTDPSTETTVVPLGDPGWPGVPSGIGDLEGVDTIAGQDDLIGGSNAAGFRDGNDTIEGDGADDVLLGDNGALVRTLQGAPGSTTEKVYAQRYPTGPLPPDATVSRTHDPDLPGPSTRFCTAAQATCEPAGAFGNDTLFGDAGNDGMWGQDGDDTLTGGDGNDDMFGELGNDIMFGNNGEDAMLGDRGGVVDEFLNADDVAARGFTATLSSVPQESYTGFRAGAYDRRVDLLHDVDGDAFIGSGTGNPMPHNGITEGGDDRIRGGLGSDNLHAGFGDDLANGDSGGDQVFGDDGADVLWGGKGCDPVADASTPDCLTNGVFDPTSRGTNDRFLDHTFGGTGGTSAASQQGALGSDVEDFNPRGSYPNNCAAGPWPTTLGSGTIDPCRWFEMTDKTDDNPAVPATLANNQHHDGIDWIYGGWDRDVLQGDRANNGPNPGDRLMDWTGAYNLYTACPASYGGYNDIRQHSPAMQDFLQKLAWGSGAGQTAGDALTPGTSAFRELALVFPADNNAHGSGPAFPTTPGHFDDPVSCSD